MHLWQCIRVFGAFWLVQSSVCLKTCFSPSPPLPPPFLFVFVSLSLCSTHRWGTRFSSPTWSAPSSCSSSSQLFKACFPLPGKGTSDKQVSTKKKQMAPRNRWDSERNKKTLKIKLDNYPTLIIKKQSNLPKKTLQLFNLQRRIRDSKFTP